MTQSIETENATYTNIPTFSYEIEVTSNITVDVMQRGLNDRGINGCKVVRDGSGCTEVGVGPGGAGGEGGGGGGGGGDGKLLEMVQDAQK